MVPVIDQHVAEINVVIRSSRAVDQYTTKQAVPGLYVEMRMIPGGSVLCRAPLVCEAVSWSDWALSHAGDAVVVVGVVLSDAMEVNRSSVVLKCIGYMHDLKVTQSVYVYVLFLSWERDTYRPSRPSQR